MIAPTVKAEPHAAAKHTSASPEAIERLLTVVRARDIRLDADTLAPAAGADVTGVAGLDLSVAEAQVESNLAASRVDGIGQQPSPRFGTTGNGPLGEPINLGDRIRQALEGGLLRLFCQPVVSLRTGSIVQWELLVRPVHVDGWLLPPASFVAAAERFGLAERLDTWVTNRAIELLNHHGSADPMFRLEVGVSAKSLSSREFVKRLELRIATKADTPKNLIIGIPPLAAPAESAAGAGFGQRLGGLGCRFALDNFGTGPTSLALLADLPVDCVKIDGRIVRHLTSDARNQTLVRGIAQLVGGVGIRSVAMHVSNTATVALLRDCGIDCAQGSHLGRPVPVKELA